MTTNEKLMKPSKAARRLKIGRTTVYDWFWEGRLAGEYNEVTRHIMIDSASVEAILKANTTYDLDRPPGRVRRPKMANICPLLLSGSRRYLLNYSRLMVMGG